jgi:hypothetical protein
MLRISEMMRLPILFCEPRGVPESILPENMRLIRSYVNNGGFIYFINTGDFKTAMAIRGIISQIIQETIADPVGDKTFDKLRKGDQDVSGYVFRNPEPNPFHPWTFFPMIIPRYTNVNLTIYNKIGIIVYADTLKNKAPGTYLQKKRDYKWYSVDNLGNEVQSGYYIYQIEADLFKKTGALRVSELRRLPNGKHNIFSSYFNISEVPSTETVSSDQLPYGERGVFGYLPKGRLAICYTEGYKEKNAIPSSDQAAREAALKWMTNVIIQAISEGSLAR